MRVLLTGGAGYIGSHTALVLLEQEHEVVVLARDVRGRGDGEVAAHAKVDAEPGVDGRSGGFGASGGRGRTLEAEEDLLRGRG